MTENEAKVLRVLQQQDRDFGVLGFATICEQTGLERKAVRRACRSLARVGMAEYVRGTCTEDGDLAGSGYRAVWS